MAANHRRYAEDAEDELEAFVQADLNEMNIPKEDFNFYLRFAFEIMGRYGRFLYFINRDQPNANVPSPRPPTYNARMFQAGMTSPYFIWPNTNPWRAQGSITDAVLVPNTANNIATTDAKLSAARQAVQAARQNHIGIFDAADPLRIEPFEIRMLSRCQSPNRWVIDLSQNNNVLIIPDLKVGQDITFGTNENKDIIYIKFNNKSTGKSAGSFHEERTKLEAERLKHYKENSRVIVHEASLNSAIEFLKLTEKKEATKEDVVKTAQYFEENHIFKKPEQAG